MQPMLLAGKWSWKEWTALSVLGDGVGSGDTGDFYLCLHPHLWDSASWQPQIELSTQLAENMSTLPQELAVVGGCWRDTRRVLPHTLIHPAAEHTAFTAQSFTALINRLKRAEEASNYTDRQTLPLNPETLMHTMLCLPNTDLSVLSTSTGG